MIFIRLYWEFFKTGLFAVGGGMATLPFLQETVRNVALLDFIILLQHRW